MFKDAGVLVLYVEIRLLTKNFYENDPAFKDLNISNLKEIENSDDYVEW